MNPRYTFLLFAFLNFSFQVFSQIEEREGKILSPTFPGGIVEVSELPPAGTKGTTYIYETWNLGSVALQSNKSIKNIPLKYDLYNNYLEISSDKGIKIVYSERIKYFEWLNAAGKKEIYYNIEEFEHNDEIEGSFFEIVYMGKLILMATKEIDYISPHYNQALDAGNQEGRYIAKERYYYIDQGNKAHKIPKKRKDFYKIFNDSSTEVESYMKLKKYSIKDKYELKKVFEYYDKIEPGI